ncbi:AAA family ATPase [Sinorhizobium fredii]|uniref:AAA family ATPase n=1 Tax=Rhizobium fredii TaxID=380 RepID=UPI001296279B|nr:AAA family ATPase [Sinorhizobium fredii]MQW99249.1 AAA family ATPase [Sinorhizobium fredii]
MYLTAEAVLHAIEVLRANVHPFIGITFVACKHYGLSVGSVDSLSMDKLTEEHLDKHHRLDHRSSHYFQPFKSAASWVKQRYPSTGLQTVNTQTFLPVFKHPRGTAKWGFAEDYLDRIIEVLKEKKFTTEIPADALAVWLYKDADVGSVSNYDELTELFFSDYRINESEKRRLFSVRMMEGALSYEGAFSSEPLAMTAVTRELLPPPDAKAEGGRTIKSLRLANAGPAREMNIDFGQRLSLITGDNGLGKSFLLDFAWWAATGSWAEREALPQFENPGVVPEVEYSLSGNSGRMATFKAKYDRKNFSWIRPKEAMTVEAIAVFSRADGSFAFADPMRSKFNRKSTSSNSLTAKELWYGRDGTIEGLLRDWIKWQTSIDRKTFDQFKSVLKRLSPEDLGALTPGDPVRIPDEPRDIPTIRHQYGVVPVTHASSGVQRVLLLAYLIIWSWQEHELAAKQMDEPPLRRMMVIVDELEAHLHPKWQRIVLPALMSVGDLLSSDLAIQMIAATHSPMILASMEASFDASIDLLYHLYGIGPTVKLEEIPFVKYGDASGWLTSPLFGLRHARSREAEETIEKAKALQLEEEPSAEAVAAISERLRSQLANDDKFWPRWLYFAEQHGVKI